VADEQPTTHVKSTTTVEEDLHSASQRRVNLIWEYTQAAIAISTVFANIIGAFFLPATNALLANAFFLIVGFYFGRTNHARVGGVQLGR
jgi:hypothetical protein